MITTRDEKLRALVVWWRERAKGLRRAEYEECANELEQLLVDLADDYDPMLDGE